MGKEKDARRSEPALIITPVGSRLVLRHASGGASPVIGSPHKEPEKPRVYPPSPGLLHIRRKRPRPHLFCNSTGFIPLRFIVAPLLPCLSPPVDGEIRAKNFQGER